jgi:hypothetical protein
MVARHLLRTQINRESATAALTFCFPDSPPPAARSLGVLGRCASLRKVTTARTQPIISSLQNTLPLTDRYHLAFSTCCSSTLQSDWPPKIMLFLETYHLESSLTFFGFLPGHSRKAPTQDTKSETKHTLTPDPSPTHVPPISLRSKQPNSQVAPESVAAVQYTITIYARFRLDFWVAFPLPLIPVNPLQRSQLQINSLCCIHHLAREL